MLGKFESRFMDLLILGVSRSDICDCWPWWHWLLCACSTDVVKCILT